MCFGMSSAVAIVAPDSNPTFSPNTSLVCPKAQISQTAYSTLKVIVLIEAPLLNLLVFVVSATKHGLSMQEPFLHRGTQKDV